MKQLSAVKLGGSKAAKRLRERHTEAYTCEQKREVRRVKGPPRLSFFFRSYKRGVQIGHYSLQSFVIKALRFFHSKLPLDKVSSLH